MDTEIFVKNVQFLCKLRGVNQTAACDESGAGKSLISEIKRGTIPSVDRIQKLAEYLGVTTSELLGEEKKEPITFSSNELPGFDRELINMICQIGSEQDAVRVKDFVRGLLASRKD